MKLTSVNIGQEGILETTRHAEKTGIYKLPVRGAVRITSAGVEGDFIASKKHHGGPDQAVYVYGGADYAWWAQELGREIAPGTFGENLTVSDLESEHFSIGDRLHIGGVTLEVTAPRIPCATFAARMGDPRFVRRFRQAERPGLYCRVIREGRLQAGDEVAHEPSRGEPVTLLEIFRDYYEKAAEETTLRRFLRAPVAIRSRRELEQRLKRLGNGTSEV